MKKKLSLGENCLFWTEKRKWAVFRIVTNQETLKSDQTRYFWDLFTAVSTLLAQLSPAAMNSARFDIKIKRIQSKMNTSFIFRKS